MFFSVKLFTSFLIMTSLLAIGLAFISGTFLYILHICCIRLVDCQFDCQYQRSKLPGKSLMRNYIQGDTENQANTSKKGSGYFYKVVWRHISGV